MRVAGAPLSAAVSYTHLDVYKRQDNIQTTEDSMWEDVYCSLNLKVRDRDPIQIVDGVVNVSDAVSYTHLHRLCKDYIKTAGIFYS